MSKSISFNLGELQEILNATLKGDPSCVVDNIATISNSNDSSISFVTDNKYKKYSKESKAAAFDSFEYFLYLLSVTKDIELSFELEIVAILSTTQLGSPFRVAFSISCNSPRLKLIDLDTTQM